MWFDTIKRCFNAGVGLVYGFGSWPWVSDRVSSCGFLVGVGRGFDFQWGPHNSVHWFWVCGVLCVVEKKKLKNKLNQRKGRWVCGHSVCSVADDGSTMGTCWWYGGFVKGGELMISMGSALCFGRVKQSWKGKGKWEKRKRWDETRG